jgi:hypothetical protein
LDVSNEGCERVEYDILRKNCELLALWCSVGAASGVQRFRCNEESAYSAQSAPLRFVRLGLAAAVPVGAAVAAPTEALAAGSLASSAAARQILMEVGSQVAKRPTQAVRAVSSCLPQRSESTSAARNSNEQSSQTPRVHGLPGVLTAVLTCLGLRLPEALVHVASTHQGVVELCEMLVDVLETVPQRGDVGPSECAAALQHFFDEVAS